MGTTYIKSACCQPKRIVKSTIPDDTGSIRGRSSKNKSHPRQSPSKSTRSEAFRRDRDESYFESDDDNLDTRRDPFHTGEHSDYSYSADCLSPQVTMSADEQEEEAKALRNAVKMGNESLSFCIDFAQFNPAIESALSLSLSLWLAGCPHGVSRLVMYYIQESEDQDLLHTRFPNGDPLLTEAVRNRAYNLIVYLITNGADVESMQQYM